MNQQPVEPMIVARLLGALDLLLQGENHCSGIGNAEGFHAYQESTKCPSCVITYDAVFSRV